MQFRDYFIIFIAILFVLSLIERYYKSRGFKNLFAFVKSKFPVKKSKSDYIQEIIDKEFAKDLDLNLPHSVNTLRAITEYETEINNGGHDQYFFNSSGDNWLFVKQSLEELNARIELEIFKKALDLFPNSKPQNNRNLRQIQLEKIDSNLFDKIDKEFYEKANLNSLYIKLIENNFTDFN